MSGSNNQRIDIAYVAVCYEAATSGVYKKIADQIDIWKSEQIFPRLIVLTDKASFNLWKEIDADCIIFEDSNLYSKVLNRIRTYWVTRTIDTQIVYFRDTFPLIMRSRKDTYVAVEIQSALEVELCQRKPWIRPILPAARRLQFSKVKRFIFVSDELANMNKKIVQNRLSKVISNGINFNRVKTLEQSVGEVKRIFFIGHPNQNWQGFDQVIKLAKSCPELIFEVVGIPSSIEYPKNVNCYGELQEWEYIPIAAQSVAALGTLALNRKALTEASPLKVREYLAMGLPVAIRYKDSDFNGADFIFQFPDNDQDISAFASEFRRFIDIWSEKRVSREQIQNISSVEKERSRLEFLGFTNSAKFEGNKGRM